jgi:hypothetical protein
MNIKSLLISGVLGVCCLKASAREISPKVTITNLALRTCVT